MHLKLYSYFRSSASYRVRIALNLKGMPYEVVPVHLLNNGGEQFKSNYLTLNPAALVPTLVDDPQILTQSIAIIEYLEEVNPAPPLLPAEPADRAFVRSIALSVACEIHPLNNLRVLQYLMTTFGIDETGKNQWYRHWCELGLSTIEEKLQHDSRVGKFCFGNAPSMADCFLIPQIANAQRLQCNLSNLPTLLRIKDNCLAIPAFTKPTE